MGLIDRAHQAFQGAQRKGRREQKTLEHIAAKAGQDHPLVVGLDALGGDVDLEGVGQTHHGLHDRDRTVARTDLGDKGRSILIRSTG